ncbi:CerR family C-terminal domain-containing protein [Martelella sp. HB161492]|uniref:CerR family C-terminal domain-containing protein n=1 Tax=Martelella sp. HB161492 TaxID=2720726 RepID=UPI001591DFDA|nr:CerR family C-terminal domain-containing protein [Martelella sp. HB161492]
MTEVLQGAAATRQALISTALKLFGEFGYNAVSTRQIADMANANIGSIAYHFGGKPGLMRACAKYVIAAMEQQFGHSALDPIPEDITRAEARKELLDSLPILITKISDRQDAEQISSFMMRHISQPGEAYDILYEEFLQPLQTRLSTLIGRATGRDPASEEVRVLTFTMMGQSTYLRQCKHTVKRSLGWEKLGPDEGKLLLKVLETNFNALIDAYSVE